MKEARAIANGVFSFVIFLLIYGFFASGHVKATVGNPRFLKMEINEDHRGEDGDHVSFSMPYAFVKGGLRLAALGNVRRELDLHIHDEVQSEVIRDIWKELSEKPEGTAVVREHEGSVLSFTRQGETLTFSVTEGTAGEDAEARERVTIRLPLRFLKAMAEGDENLCVETLLDELPNLQEGELLNVKSKDGSVRIWIE